MCMCMCHVYMYMHVPHIVQSKLNCMYMYMPVIWCISVWCGCTVASALYDGYTYYVVMGEDKIEAIYSFRS